MTHDDVYDNNVCANDDDDHSPQESRSVNSFAFKKSIRTTVECRSSLLEQKSTYTLKHTHTLCMLIMLPSKDNTCSFENIVRLAFIQNFTEK